jgi:glycosyltransferase involved in cell wall biosynthesis
VPCDEWKGILVDCEKSDISVVIAYHNREQYIDEAIQSVLAQTLQPLEIIIVNDCSRESSRRYLDRYAGACTIIDLPVNGGPATARNEGIRRARGEFIAFLDDDDIWLPEKLERQFRYMAEHPRCHLVHGALWAFYSDRPDRPDRLWTRDWPGPLALPSAMRQEYSVTPSTILILANVVRALRGFDPRFSPAEDFEFRIRCAAAGYRIESIPEPLVRYRQQSHGSLTEQNWRMILAGLRLCWNHKALYYRVYGVRGIVSFILDRMERWTRNVRYVGGAVRLLLRIIPVKWEVRPGYEEPVQREVSPVAPPAGFVHEE